MELTFIFIIFLETKKFFNIITVHTFTKCIRFIFILIILDKEKDDMLTGDDIDTLLLN